MEQMDWKILKEIAELEKVDDAQDQATLVTNQKKLEWCEAQLKHVSGAAA